MSDYSIDNLIKAFEEHHWKSLELNKKLAKKFQENNPGEPIPDAFTDDFSLPLALKSICQEIKNLKDSK